MNTLFSIDIISAIIRTTTPILFAALGGLICYRAGVFNIGLEGLMLTGSFITIAVAHWTENTWLGILAAGFCSCLLSLIMAVVILRFKANMIIAGLGLNGLAIGLTTFLMESVLGSTGAFTSDKIKPLVKVPLPFVDPYSTIGQLLSYTPLIYFAFISVFLVFFFLYYTKTGLSIRMVGEHPVAAKTAGINILRHKYISMAVCGFLCGIAGAHLATGYVTMFTENMTAGRGFVAFTAVVFGNAHPIWVMITSLFFGWTDAIGLRAQLIGIGFPTEFILMIPYIMTIIALTISAIIRRGNQPFSVLSEAEVREQ